jgi:hypothetical protein
VVLAGQPELASRLEQPDLRQLKQRVTLRAELQPFQLEETAGYIASRITTAGGVPGRIFTLEAVTLIHEFSGGIPRTISVICDNVLVNGMALGRHMIDRATVTDVCRDLHLTRAAETPAPGDKPGGSAASPPRATDLAPSRPPGKQQPQPATAPAKPERQRTSLLASTGRVGRIVT